jgi:hypothetical protein
MGSSSSTLSPACFSTAATVPSEMLSPRAGILTCTLAAAGAEVCSAPTAAAAAQLPPPGRPGRSATPACGRRRDSTLLNMADAELERQEGALVTR